MKIFIDTAPFIYLIENHPEFAKKVKQYISNTIIRGDRLITSVITIMEFGVKPQKEEKQEIINRFEELLDRLGIEVVEIDREIAKTGYKLRAKYGFLKGMDAMQLATALKNGCEEFVTNDIPLTKIQEIKVILIKELE